MLSNLTVFQSVEISDRTTTMRSAILHLDMQHYQIACPL
jgi:hypothetical protein